MTSQLRPPPWTSDSAASEAVFNLLVHYLDDCSHQMNAASDAASGEVATAATVRRLGELFSTVTTTAETGGDESGNLDAFGAWRSVLRYFFATTFHIVIQTPPSSPTQAHLVTLLVAIRAAPNPDNPPQEFYDTSGTTAFWAELPTWRSVWADFERRAPLPPRSVPLRTPPQTPPWPEQPLTGAEWASMNAFLAKLHVAAPDLIYVSVRALFALIDALEDQHDPRTLDALVPVAAWWVVEAGEALMGQDDFVTEGPEDGSRRLPWSRGDLWTGPGGFSPERWWFWRERFEAVAGQESVAAETRQMAARAKERIRAASASN